LQIIEIICFTQSPSTLPRCLKIYMPWQTQGSSEISSRWIFFLWLVISFLCVCLWTTVMQHY